MIKRLRRRLMAVSMISLFLVLAVIMGMVNLFNYRSIVSRADGTTAILAAGEGSFPAEWIALPAQRGDAPRPEPSREGAAAEERHPIPGKGHFSPELPFASRYFSVLFAEDGAVLRTDTSRIAAIGADTAVKMADAVRTGRRECGFERDYRYLRLAEEEGIRVIFLDCTQDMATFRHFLCVSCAISAAGLLAVFVLILLLSRRIVRPVSESYEKQRRFITDAGHELKTPLTVIDADAEVLEMELGENEWLRDIRRQTGRLSRLTADLIYLSRMEEERVEIQMIDFPLSDVVAETAQSFSAPARTQGKQFSTEVEPMLSLCGDEKAIRQLVSILLDNAIKYSPAGGEIALTLRRQGRGLTLTVRNTAEPIADEQLARLFDRFYRVDSSHSTSGGGYGIGLSIARAVAVAHRGKINAVSEGGSLTVTVSFPCP